jgi:hypothetical protein
MRNIYTKLSEYIKESTQNKSVNFKDFPKDILETLENEYGHYYLHNFDWNKMADSFDSSEEFNAWLEDNKKEEFIKNLELIIRKATQDMITIKKQNIIDKKLKYFEELIKPTLGSEVLGKHLTRYQEDIIMNPNATIEDIEEVYKDSKGILDKDGSIDQDKITMSEYFDGDDINLPNFERFVEKNPEFQGVFNDWKKLFDESMAMTLVELNAFRNSTSIDKIRNMRDFLINYKKSL